MYVPHSHRLVAQLTVLQDLPDDGKGHADPQTYLHRIGRTGRFGRVGVAIAMVCGQQSYRLVKEISEYFAIEMTSLPYNDWDQIEEIVKKVVKSSRAGANFTKATIGQSNDINM